MKNIYYYIISILPIVLYPIVTNSSVQHIIHAYTSNTFLINLLLFIFYIVLMRHHIKRPKKFAYTALLLSPFILILSFFSIFIVGDVIDSFKFNLFDLSFLLFMPVITIYFILCFFFSK